MDRQEALLAWAQNTLDDSNCHIKPASSDASFRSYWRAFSKEKTYIVMDAPIEHEDCTPFIDISKKLVKAGVQVPHVIAQNLEQGFLLLSDLGEIQYLSVLNKDNCLSLYSDALVSLHKMQQNASLENLLEYDQKLLQDELNLFEKWFINVHLDVELTNEQQAIIQKTNTALIHNAISQPQTFVHRDYHSRNLMKTENNNPGILDFQDAVIGAVTYDLASLLKDCYIQWDENIITELLDNFRIEYNKLNGSDFTIEQWQEWFDLMSLQRHLKVAGIFCRLNYRDKKPNYLKDLNLTLCYIKEICSKYQKFRPLLNLINDISPSMDFLCKP